MTPVTKGSEPQDQLSKEPDQATETETVETPKPEKLSRVIHEAIQLELRSSFSGPLPPPQILRGYNEIIPDGAERLLQMAEKEQAHRHRQEEREADGDLTLAKRGQLIGGGLALIAVVGAIYLLATGKSVTGLAVLGAVVAAFGTAFVYDRIRSKPSPAEPPAGTNGNDTPSELPSIPLPNSN
jgi:uncharacterized membrane protein